MGPVVVKGRGCMGGRSALVGAGLGLLFCGPEDCWSSLVELVEGRTSLPFSKSAPPNVAHFRIVWIRWFCLRGFERYSSIWAWMHFSRSPSIAWAVRAMIGVRCVPRLRSYSRILAVASNPPCLRLAHQNRQDPRAPTIIGI
jgi:hypothetical protein